MTASLDELIRPIGPLVTMTQSAREALALMDRNQAHEMAVANLYHQPLAFILRDDVEELRRCASESWMFMRCSSLLRRPWYCLRTDSTLDDARGFFEEHGARPTVVVGDTGAVGALYEEDVLMVSSTHGWDISQLGQSTLTTETRHDDIQEATT